MDMTLFALLNSKIKAVASGVSSVTVTGTTLNFVFTNGSTAQMVFPTPADGVSITDVDINGSNHLICTMSDGSTIDAGQLPSGNLTEELKATVDIGSVTSGKVYPQGTPLETVLRDILIKKENPVVNFSLTPPAILYDKVNDTVSSLVITATVTKKTNNIASVKFYVDNVLVKTITTGVTSGGTFTYTHNFDTPTNTDFNVKVIAEDIEELTGTKSQNIKFVGKSYYGYVESTVGEPTATQIKALQNSILKDSKGFVYSGITFDYNKVVYAYPSSFGALTSIKDVENNINYTSSFTKTTVTVDGISYYCYTQNDASQAVGINITFA